MKVKIHSLFDPPKSKGITCLEESQVKMSDLPLSDINLIMKRYPVTRQLPQTVRTASYMDLAGNNSSLIRDVGARLEKIDGFYDRLSDEQKKVMDLVTWRRNVIDGSISDSQILAMVQQGSKAEPVEDPKNASGDEPPPVDDPK